jgi:hypothetical protein
VPSASASTAPVLTDAQRAEALGQRIVAARTKAVETLAIDGRPDSKMTYNLVRYCRDAPAACVEAARPAEAEFGVAVRLGHAERRLADAAQYGILSREREIVEAEKMIDEAHDQAVREAKERDDAEKAVAAEQAEMEPVTLTCARTPAVCQKTCEDSKTPSACVVWALTLEGQKKYDEADKILQRTCDAKFMTACKDRKDLGKVIAAHKAEVDAAWGSLVMIADDIITKKGQAAFARSHFKKARDQAAAGRMEEHVALLLRDSYCPAQKDFVHTSSRTDLAARSKAHCKETAPTISGGGEERITLTAECNAVFATSCP